MKQMVKFFLILSVSFTIIWAIVGWSDHPEMVDYIIVGVSFGLMTTGIVSIIQWISVKKKGIVGKVSVKASSRFIVKGSINDIYELCAESIRSVHNCKIDFYDPRYGIVKARTKLSWLSWGEEITLMMKEVEENRYELWIKSEPVLKTTLIDYGKNLENIRHISSYMIANPKLEVTPVN